MSHTLMDTLGMETIKTSKEEVMINMPVTDTVKQPMGFLHGGATVALAETAASVGGLQQIDTTQQSVVGVEINCNHIKAKKDGVLTASATPLHIGKQTMVFSITVTDEKEQLIATSRCTLGII
ncbi:esterase YuxO [Gracilibacillus halophilus YIM-C55.5]|uniref:Esterase YuxO n=1 Tax=Gracilibacillus halophilus YIM-C55.5 TaxID=1308866 RepID=N4WRV7_9BACI|nr:esterase YuxO [Gracilibacillus halophilus YIM-C55.5]